MACACMFFKELQLIGLWPAPLQIVHRPGAAALLPVAPALPLPPLTCEVVKAPSESPLFGPPFCLLPEFFG